MFSKTCKWLIVTMCAAFALAPALSAAADMCKAQAIMDTPSQDDPHSILHAGETLDSVSQYSFNKKTGEGIFCQHGGYCYPRYSVSNGQRVEVLMLMNCTIGKGVPDSASDPDGVWFYDLVMDPAKNSARDMAYDKTDGALIDLGLCMACASNAAEEYVDRPNSACSAIIKKALDGDKDAADKLNELNDKDYFSQPGKCEDPEATGQNNAATAASIPPDTNSSPPTPKPESAAALKHDQPKASAPIQPAEIVLLVIALCIVVPSIVAVTNRKRGP